MTNKIMADIKEEAEKYGFNCFLGPSDPEEKTMPIGILEHFPVIDTLSDEVIRIVAEIIAEEHEMIFMTTTNYESSPKEITVSMKVPVKSVEEFRKRLPQLILAKTQLRSLLRLFSGINEDGLKELVRSIIRKTPERGERITAILSLFPPVSEFEIE